VKAAAGGPAAAWHPVESFRARAVVGAPPAGGHAPKAYRPRHPEALQALTEKGSRRAFAVRRGGLADRGPAAPSAGRAGAKSL